MPRTRDLAIFVTTTDKTDCFTPSACARGNYANFERFIIAFKADEKAVVPSSLTLLQLRLYTIKPRTLDVVDLDSD